MATRSTAQDTTSEFLESAEDTIGAFADRAYEAGKEQARSTVNEQKNAFKQFCMTIVRALRRGSDELRDEGYNTVAGLVDDAANKAEDFTHDVDDFDVRSTTERVDADARAEVSAEEVRKLIAEAAYYRAKKRGFTPGHEVEDWVQAEAEVLRRIGADHPSR